MKATPRSEQEKEALNERIDNAMMRYDFLVDEFQKSDDRDRTDDQQIEGRGSEMIEKDKPNTRPPPPENSGPAIDGAAFDQRWQDEQNNAQQPHKDDDPSRDDDQER